MLLYLNWKLLTCPCLVWNNGTMACIGFKYNFLTKNHLKYFFVTLSSSELLIKTVEISFYSHYKQNVFIICINVEGPSSETNYKVLW